MQIPGVIDKIYILYVLIDQITDEVRYVGQTSMGLKRRLSSHLSKKLKPIIKEVSRYSLQDDVNLAEIELVSKYRENTIRPTNLVSVGNVAILNSKSLIEKFRNSSKEVSIELNLNSAYIRNICNRNSK